jgi:hypothetical protein
MGWKEGSWVDGWMDGWERMGGDNGHLFTRQGLGISTSYVYIYFGRGRCDLTATLGLVVIYLMT